MHAERTLTESGGRLRKVALWAAPVVVLFALWLWAAFSSGGYLPRQWLPPNLALGLFALVAAIWVAYPRRPRQLGLAVILCFSLYVVWVAFSSLWAESTSRVWLESARSLSYLLLFYLALVYLTRPEARLLFRYLLMAGSLVLLLATAFRVWTASDINLLFFENRLVYPISYPNAAAALFLLPFWPLLWLAVDRKEKALTRGLALGIAAGLLTLGFVTQSRGAFWALGLTTVLTFVVSPARLKTLLYLLPLGLLMVWAFPRLNQYWQLGPAQVGGALVGRVALVVLVVGAFIGLILALLEGWIKVSGRMRVVFGSVILAGALAGAVYGATHVSGTAGGPIGWLRQTWGSFVGEKESHLGSQTSQSSAARMFTISASGRTDIWRVAVDDFKAHPVLGIGADNFVFSYDMYGNVAQSRARQAHSIELQVLSETGAIGGTFFFGGVVIALAGTLWPRCSSGRRGRQGRKSRAPVKASAAAEKPVRPTARWGTNSREYGWAAALFCAFVYWLVHASVEWLWQTAGVTTLAFLILAAGISDVDARAGTLWPTASRVAARVSRWLRRVGRDTTPSDSALISNRINLALTGEGDEAREGSSGHSVPEASTARAEPGLLVPSARDEGRQTGRAAEAGQAGFRRTLQDPALAPADQRVAAESVLKPERRSLRHLSRWKKRKRRLEKRTKRHLALLPSGPLSRSFRLLLGLLAVVLLVIAGLPYVSLRLQDAALGVYPSDPLSGIARADAAAWLQPIDPEPLQVKSHIYSWAAEKAAGSNDPARGAVVLDDLSLAIAAQERAVERGPADWSIRYEAGISTLNLYLARSALTGGSVGQSAPSLGIDDWSILKSDVTSAPGLNILPGSASASLAMNADLAATAAGYRSLSGEQLLGQSRKYLNEALERYPLSSQAKMALEFLQLIAQGQGPGP